MNRGVGADFCSIRQILELLHCRSDIHPHIIACHRACPMIFELLVQLCFIFPSGDLLAIYFLIFYLEIWRFGGCL